MKARQGLAILILAGVGVIATVVFMAMRGKPTPVEDWELNKEVPLILGPGEEPAETQAPIEVAGTELTVVEDGEVVWRASFGGQIELDQQGRTGRAEQVDWQFEGKGFEGLAVRAPLMVADYDMKELRFSSGVDIEAEKGDLRFSANDVTYQFGTHKLIATGDVRFQSGAFAGEAEELVIDNRSRTIRLKRGQLTRRQ